MLVPISSVTAASPAVTLSPTSGGVGARLAITVTGFLSGSPLDIYFDTRQTSPYNTVLAPTSTSTTSGIASLISSLSADSNPSSGTACSTTKCWKTDADGNFQVTRLQVPTLAGGSHNLIVTDGTNTVTTAFTVSSSVTVRKYQASCALSGTASTSNSLSSGFPDQQWTTACVAAYGFAAGDTVSFSASGIFTSGTVPASCTAGSSSSSTPGACVSSTTTVNFDIVSGGAKSFTATGSASTGCGTAACTASKTITINPAIALYNTQTGLTAFSFPGASPTSFLLEGYGFPASSTIASGSITVGGVTTSHSAISTSSTGTFGVGGNAHIVVAPSGSVPLGATTIVIPGATSTGSVTFGYTQGNVILGAGQTLGTCTAPCDSTANTLPNAASTTATTLNPIYRNVNVAIKYGWGQPIISSVKPASAGTLVTALDASSYMPNTASNSYTTSAASNAGSATPTLFGWGSATSSTASITLLTITVPSTVGGLAWSSMPAPDSNGAFWALASTGLGDSSVRSTSQSATVTVTAPAVDSSTTLSPSFTITPWVYLTTGSALNPEAINFNTAASTLTLEAHGFQASLSTTVTVDGSSATTSTSTTGTTGAFTGVTITTTPDLAYGSHTVAVSDGTYSSSDTTFTLPAVAATTPGSSTSAALSSNSGAAGSSTTLRTGTAYGVHGLKASTTYSLYWGLTATTAISGSSFTTDSKGKIPAPGISFSVPAGTVGNHILVIKDSAGTDVLFNSILLGDGGAPVGGSSVGSATYQSSLSASLTGQYMDLLFSLTATLTVTPTVGYVGTSVRITGTGLSPTTTYYASTAQQSSCATTQAGTTAYQTFASDATGTIPASTSFTFPALPTVGTTAGTYPEQGTTYCVYASTAAGLQAGTSSAFGTFVLQGQATLSASSANAGGSVTLTATGLIASATYSIVFNYGVNSGGTAYTGTSVGAFTADSVTGGGSLAFTVPSTAAAATYTIQLARLAGGPGSSALGVLASAPSLTVGAPSTAGLTTGTFVATGSPTEGTVSGTATVSQSFTNTASTSLSVYMWVSVLNSAGQTVGVFLGSATVGAGATATIGAALFNLPSGSYTASVFITTTSGTVVSTTSTTSSFTV